MARAVDVQVINLDTRDHVEEELIRVERKPSDTDAYFLAEGKFMVVTSNGESYCEGPVWILWDTSGYPYPITPEEFDMLYVRI